MNVPRGAGRELVGATLVVARFPCGCPVPLWLPQGRVLPMNVCGGLALTPTPRPTCEAQEGVVLFGLIRRGNS